MFGSFREALISIGAKILLVILVLSFAVWGIGDQLNFGAGGGNTVATVGETEIPRRAYDAEVRRQTSRLRRALGDALTDEQLRAMGVSQRVLESMVQSAVFVEGARDLGLFVAEDTIAREIKTDARFQGAAGRFNRDRFNTILYDNGYSEGAFVEIFRADMMRTQLLSGIASGQTAPKTLVNAIHAYRMERRIAEVVSIANKKLAIIAVPTEGEIAKYHKDNAARFTAPEFRDFTLVRLQIEDVLDEVAVPEEKIRQAYDERLNDFSQPERRKIKQILVATEELARKVHDELGSGGDFDKVAKETAKADPASLDLGELSRAQVPLPELADAAFGLGKGAFSQPVKTVLGWHILKVTDVSPAKQSKFDDVRAQLKNEMAKELAVDALYNLSNKFEDSLGGGATLVEAAEGLNFKPKRIKGASRAGSDDNGKAIAGLDAEVLRTLFETNENTDSALVDAGERGYFMLHVDKVTKPALRPLARVRAVVTEALRRERSAEAAGKKAETLLGEIKSGRSLAEVAKAHGAKVRTSKPFTRTGDGLQSRLPGDLVAAIFSARRGDAAASQAGEEQVIAVLKDIRRANPLADKEGVARIAEQLNQGIGGDLTAQLAAALRNRLGVSVNQLAIDPSSLP